MRTRLREMTPADMPALKERLKEQNKRDGTDYQVPRVFDSSGRRVPACALALVAYDVETGEVMQGHVYERTLEQMSFGISPEATVCSMHEQDAVFFLLREKGYRDLHVLVPNPRVKDMKHGLEKILAMKCTRKHLTHFYRLLDTAQNDELRQWYADQEATH
jgi:hypothetical protein